MWKQIAEIGKQLLNFAQRMNKFEAEQTQLREDVNRVERLLERLLIAEENNREVRDRERQIWERDQKILMLELQRELDRFERRLPPAS
jgi:hypothetical protein